MSFLVVGYVQMFMVYSSVIDTVQSVHCYRYLLQFQRLVTEYTILTVNFHCIFSDRFSINYSSFNVMVCPPPPPPPSLSNAHQGQVSIPHSTRAGGFNNMLER